MSSQERTLKFSSRVDQPQPCWGCMGSLHGGSLYVYLSRSLSTSSHCPQVWMETKSWEPYIFFGTYLFVFGLTVYPTVPTVSSPHVVRDMISQVWHPHINQNLSNQIIYNSTWKKQKNQAKRLKQWRVPVKTHLVRWLVKSSINLPKWSLENNQKPKMSHTHVTQKRKI